MVTPIKIFSTRGTANRRADEFDARGDGKTENGITFVCIDVSKNIENREIRSSSGFGSKSFRVARVFVLLVFFMSVRATAGIDTVACILRARVA